MPDRFDGRGFIVTGGTRGIGRAVVLAAAAEGAHVVLCGRADGDVAAREELLATAGNGRVSFVPADVSREADVERLFDVAIEQLPRLDVVVNNAGAALDRLLVETTLDEWNTVLGTNLRGPFLMCRRAVEEFLGAGGGRIVNVASFAANGLVGQGAYATAKSALLALSRSVAKEYGRRGIACNAVVPGFIETAMTAGLAPGAQRSRARLSPYGRFGTAEEVADAVLFLASDEASFVNGDELYVAGAVRDVPRFDP